MEKKRAIHLAPFDRNVGDNALNIAIEQMLEPILSIERMELVANPFDEAVMDQLDRADVVIFGGGGVIHSCSGDSSRKNREKTGTMWNMDLDRIERLRSKIVLYCVGYNRFQGEPEPLPAMGDFFSVLDRKGALVRFRNDGSLDRFLEFFPQFGGIKVAPDPGAFCRGDAPLGDHVLVQIATDRPKFRFPKGINEFVATLNVFLERIPHRKILFPHTNSDEKIYKAIGGSLFVDEIRPVRIDIASTMEAMNLYKSARYTLSMRGHSQICSVGNGTPTFAISTHPKARGYMIDNGMPECFFDYLNEETSDGLAKFDKFIGELDQWRAHLVNVNDEFDAEIHQFNEMIRKYVYEDFRDTPLLVARSNIEPAAVKPSVIGQKVSVKKDVKASEEIELGVNQRGGRGFVIACDANYFPGVAGCVSAIRRYNKYPITFLNTGVTAEQLAELEGAVDNIIDLNFIHDLKIPTSKHTAHLNKSALSSLYAHLSGYDEIIYVDIDALVLGSLEPMFEALESHEIAGVRGNQIREYFEGTKHTVGQELTPKGLAYVASIKPSFNAAGVAINSGCFAVRAETLKLWESWLAKLLPYLPEFKLVDQSILNVILQLSDANIKLLDRSYNLMGLQFSRTAKDKFELEAVVDEDHCKIYFAGKRIRVAHFSGRNKPWMVTDESVGSLAWQWHSQPDRVERKRLAIQFNHRTRATGGRVEPSDRSSLAAYKIGDRVRLAYSLLEVGDAAGAREWLAAGPSDELPGKSLRLALAVTDSFQGKAVEALEELDRLAPNGAADKNPIRVARRAALNAAFGEDGRWREHGSRPRSSSSAGPEAESVTSGVLDGARFVSVERRETLGARLATACALHAAGVAVEPAAVVLDHKSNSAPGNWDAADASAAAALLDALSSNHPALVPEGAAVLQIGSGSGALLDGMSALYGARAFALDPIPSLSSGVLAKHLTDEDVAPDFYSGEMKFDLIVLNNVLSRSSSPADILLACRSLLVQNGQIIISDARSTGDELHGLILSENRSALDWRRVQSLIEAAGLERLASHLVEGTAVYISRATSAPTDMPSDVAASLLLATVKNSSEVSSLSPVRINADARAVSDWMTDAPPKPDVAANHRSVLIEINDQPAYADLVVSQGLSDALAARITPGLKTVRLKAGSVDPFSPITSEVSVAQLHLEGIRVSTEAMRKSLVALASRPRLLVAGLSAERAGAKAAWELSSLVQQGAMIGALTNRSVEAIRQALPPELVHRVLYLPPVSFARRWLTGHIANGVGSGGQKVIGLNFSASFIRTTYRAGVSDIIDRLRDLVRQLDGRGCQLRYVSHSVDDVPFGLLLERACPEIAHIRLNGKGLPDIHRVYRTMDMFLGLRAEPMFWAWGLGIPGWALLGDPLADSFADDIGRPGWMIDPNDVEFSGKTLSIVENALANAASYREDVRRVGDRLQAQTEFATDLINRGLWN